jgi:hypothetical protein
VTVEEDKGVVGNRAYRKPRKAERLAGEGAKASNLP